MQASGDIDDGAQGRRDALIERLLGSTIGMMDLYALHIGDRLGLYRALAEGAATPGEVAAASATHERYAREWLEHQAVGGILEVEDASAEPGERCYRIPAGHREVLLPEEGGPNCLAPLARTMVAMVRPLGEVMEAFRTGGGVPFDHYDADLSEGLGEGNGALFDAYLGSAWLPAVADLDARLRAEPPARVADLGCGTGRSTLAMARAYPAARFDGIDLDAHSIGVARGNLAAQPELAGRVAFQNRDAADPGLAGAYDLVTIFEAVHDMSDPVGALRAARALLAPGGSLLVADERVAEHFTAPGDEVERLMYGFSILHCLPAGMAEQPSAATGTVMRPDTLRGYALAAGFAEMDVLPIEDLFWRFYRLRPPEGA